MQKEYDITIYPDGKIHVEAEGFKGKKCMDFIAFLEQEGVGKITKRDYKKEYYAYERETEEVEEKNTL
ncbi:MAG: DUF2997 domain-containing protein [bacterium]